MKINYTNVKLKCNLINCKKLKSIAVTFFITSIIQYNCFKKSIETQIETEVDVTLDYFNLSVW